MTVIIDSVKLLNNVNKAELEFNKRTTGDATGLTEYIKLQIDSRKEPLTADDLDWITDDIIDYIDIDRQEDLHCFIDSDDLTCFIEIDNDRRNERAKEAAEDDINNMTEQEILNNYSELLTNNEDNKQINKPYNDIIDLITDERMTDYLTYYNIVNIV